MQHFANPNPGRAAALCQNAAMRPVRGFFFGYFWFSSATGGREI
ncbi:MAG TPA: hypothetical protein VFE74_06100 [Ramlibacter sp.]|jgi:hypothetical protein|nr:hypothetical protein [Ramlibacter sp.]